MAKRKSSVYCFEPVLTIRDAARLKKDLLALFDAGTSDFTIRLDTSEKVDLAIIQILISFIKEVRLRKIPFRITGPLNPNLSQLLEDSDFLKITGNRMFLFDQLQSGGVEIETE